MKFLISAFSISAFSFCLCAGPVQFMPVPVPGLVAHWTMNEGSGSVSTADLSGQGSIMFLTNSPAWTNGVIGRGLNFSGASSQIAATAPVGTLTNSFATFSAFAWVKAAAETDKYLLSSYSTTSNNRRWQFGQIASGKFRGVISGDGTSSVLIALDTVDTVFSGNWVHCGITFTNGTMRLWTNGVLATTTTTLTNTILAIPAFSIGTAIGGSLSAANYSTAQIDDARIYTNALTAEQVLTLYNGGIGTAQ